MTNSVSLVMFSECFCRWAWYLSTARCGPKERTKVENGVPPPTSPESLSTFDWAGAGDSGGNIMIDFKENAM